MGNADGRGAALGLDAQHLNHGGNGSSISNTRRCKFTKPGRSETWGQLVVDQPVAGTPTRLVLHKAAFSVALRRAGSPWYHTSHPY